jgi:hypothetical protein
MVTRRPRRVHPVFALNLARNSESELGAPNAEISHPGTPHDREGFLFVEKKHPISCGISTIMTLADGHGRIDVDHPGNSAICPWEKLAASW